MKYLCITCSLFLASCQFLPEMSKSLEDIETDNAITIEIQKEAMQKETDVRINLEIQNKDVPVSK